MSLYPFSFTSFASCILGPTCFSTHPATHLNPLSFLWYFSPAVSMMVNRGHVVFSGATYSAHMQAWFVSIGKGPVYLLVWYCIEECLSPCATLVCKLGQWGHALGSQSDKGLSGASGYTRPWTAKKNKKNWIPRPFTLTVQADHYFHRPL